MLWIVKIPQTGPRRPLGRDTDDTTSFRARPLHARDGALCVTPIGDPVR